ncbi:MAG: hypothetical protein ACKV19_02305, partial [Verrucomicrobiales bacterium]
MPYRHHPIRTPQRWRPLVAAAVMVVALTMGRLAAVAAEWSTMTIGKSAGSAPPAAESNVRWFRAYVRVPDSMVTPQEKDLWRDSMTLSFPGLDGRVTVWLNGRQIINSGQLTAADGARFKVPKGILETETFNAFVVRWRGPGAAGFPEFPLFAGYFDELPLGPIWETTADEPAAADLQPRHQAPAQAAYTESQFRPATTPLQVAAARERGIFVSPDDAL